MNVERAREILDPEHRENYDGMEAVNEACRMGRDALGKLVPLRPYPDGDKNIMACPRWRVWPKERKTKRAAVKPDAEALELVRCKDCRNLEITGCYGECRKGYLGIVRPDDFCSRAEKRGGVR